MNAFVLKNLRLYGNGQPYDIKIQDSKIVQIGADLGVGEDFEGKVVLPGLVEAHCHLDKNYSLQEGDLENNSGTLPEAIRRWNDSVQKRSQLDYKKRAEFGLQQALSCGVTYLRTHVDMIDRSGFLALEAILELKAQWQSRITMQIVVLGLPGTSAHDFLIAEALEMGADVVGGCPMLTPNSKASLQSALDLAERYHKPLDLHLDETENADIFELATLCQMVSARGLAGQVSAGHCCSLAFQNPETQARVIDQVLAAGIRVISLPAANLILQGKGQPPARGLAPLKALHQAGVGLALGSDNVCDPFLPLGNYDPLWQANLAIHAADLTSPPERQAALRMVCDDAATLLGLNHYGLKVGSTADLVILDCSSWEQALALLPPRLRVYKAGQLRFYQEVTRAWI